MLDQGGDLALAPSASGATFVLTLPRARAATRPVLVPAQRSRHTTLLDVPA
jgi:hypothetical protein